ncbi:hypothetical protein XELAEV_18037868mg [Xenopus laevis]|uniref:PH domain-containing protein n=1 Tax=Xenopus laevis TaxID=8355 RepID=A0A974HAL8_XENLA|nr:hypothetical protein XELAEV_18037868mg [Xenopus laevis]
MTEEMERPRSGLSMASSVATNASVSQGSRDSSGLRLWKRRWFVLSDLCLFYYRDSREEIVLGSILLPSYQILPANPREVKNRRFSFKAEHPGMRTYYFGADTHEDMNAWIRAMNHSALVVSEEKMKNSQIQNLSNSTQEDLYASYEDFLHSGIGAAGEHAKSAESLEIAHLSETRSQDEGSRESLPEQERNGDLDKDSLFNGLKESLTDAIQHFTTLSQNGSVPPPTPENGVKVADFPYSRLELENQRSLERKDSIPEDEEWVPFHKGEPDIKESLESYSARSPSRVPPKGFECPHDVYSSPLSRSAPSSPAVLPGHMYICEAGERNSRDGKYVAQREPPESPQTRLLSSISSCSPSRVTTCPSPEIREYVIQRLVKPSRSLSLPPTPSEHPRHRMAKMSPPPSVKYGVPFISEKSMNYSDTSHASPGPTVGSPTRKDILYCVSRSPKGQPNPSQAASNEDLAVSASPSLGRTTVRSNTPVGRVDMVPAEDKAGNFIHGPRHIEDRAYFVTSSRIRSHMMKSLSRPQTPSDRYDVLPTEERYSSSTMAKGPNRYSRRSQPLGAEDERLVDGCGMPIPQRTHAYPNSRMQMRPSTPAERIIVEECPPELSLTPPLRRHGSHVTRYSERPLLPQGTFSGHAVGSVPRQLQKLGSSSYSQLPPLPPVSGRPGPHVPVGKRMSLSAMPSGSAPYRERVPYPVRLAENNIDVLLTKLCGQDKLLVSLEDETAHLRAEKEKLEDALQATHHHLEEFQGQDHVIENIWYQQRLLQDDLVYVRARLCDLTLERERVWEEYRGLDNELHTVRETLDRVSHIGHLQDQLAAQRDLWMINDIISGLQFNKSTIHVLPESSRHPGMMIMPSPTGETPPAYQRSFLHHSGLHPATPRDSHKDCEAVPPRPPLPRDHHSTASSDVDGKNRVHSTDQNEPEQLPEHLTDSSPSTKAGPQPASTPGDAALRRDVGSDTKSSCPVAIPTGNKVISEAKASPPCLAEVGTVRKQRMSAEEQMERMRRHQEAQIHERPKPGVTTQRQNSQRGSTPIISRLRSASSDMISPGPNSPQVDSACPEQRRPALVKVTASFYPSTTSTPQPSKGGSFKLKASSNKVQENQAIGYYSTDDPTYSLVMEPQSDSVVSTTCLEISPMAKMTPPLRTSSKIVTATCKQAKRELQEDKQEQRLIQATSISEIKSHSAPQPEHLEVKKKPVERVKSPVSKSSPATSPGCSRHSDDSCNKANAGQKEHVISLSYTLASEASELGKLITAKTVADDTDANSDISTSDEAYPWDFIMQDSRSSKQPETNERCQFKVTPDTPQGEDRNANVAENGQTYYSSNQCSSGGPQLQHHNTPKGHTDNQHYENWPSPREKGSTDHCQKIPQDSTMLSKCNGQVANYEFLIQDLHYNPLNVSKVAEYCKEEREPIRITLLQSSF